MDKTIIVITSDHGESFSHGYLFRHVDRVYESLLRIPLLIYVPRGVAPGLKVQPVRLIDLAPTLAELMAVDLQPCDGSSLAPILQRNATSATSLIYGQAPARRVPWSRGTVLSIRDGRWKLINYVDESSIELFDLDQDPAEVNDLAALEAPIASGLENRLSAWRNQFSAPTDGSYEIAADDQEKLKSLGYLQ